MKPLPSNGVPRCAPGTGVALSLFSALAIAFAVLLLSFPRAAAAQCVCRCIDGQLGAICQGAADVAPVCAPRTCPATTWTTPPRLAQSAPPPGTTQCRMAQVLNPATGQYEWMEVCN